MITQKTCLHDVFFASYKLQCHQCRFNATRATKALCAFPEQIDGKHRPAYKAPTVHRIHIFLLEVGPV